LLDHILTLNMTYRPHLLAIAHLLVPCLAVAADVLQGGWDHRFVVSAWNPATGTYQAIVDERRRECLSESYLSEDSFRSPEADRRRLPRSFGECSIIDQASDEGVSTWSMACVESDGRRTKLKTTSTVSRKKVVLVTEIESARQTADDRPLRMVREYDFVGACASPDGRR
jgi:hypothetical protein